MLHLIDGSLTKEAKYSCIDKGEVSLKDVQDLHKSPLRRPHQVNLHPNGQEVVVQEHRCSSDCVSEVLKVSLCLLVFKGAYRQSTAVVSLRSARI